MRTHGVCIREVLAVSAGCVSVGRGQTVPKLNAKVERRIHAVLVLELAGTRPLRLDRTRAASRPWTRTLTWECGLRSTPCTLTRTSCRSAKSSGRDRSSAVPRLGAEVDTARYGIRVS